MSRRRLAWVAGALTVAGALSVGAYAIKKQIDWDASCDVMTAYLSEFGELQTVGSGDPVIAVLGDSYSSGDGLKDRSERWADDLAEITGGTVVINGVGMTGFVNGGYCSDQQFGTRIDSVVNVDPDVLVIQGGINDWEADASQVKDAVDAILYDARNVERVIVIGPGITPTRDTSRVESAISQAVQDAGFEYVSTTVWELALLPDGLHMTPEGHRVYADHVARAILD